MAKLSVIFLAAYFCTVLPVVVSHVLPNTGGSSYCGVHDKPVLEISDKARRKRAFVIEGVPSNKNGWPWLVQYGPTDGSCGGSLIRLADSLEETDIIITAAHCYENLSAILAGQHNKDIHETTEQKSKHVDIRCPHTICDPDSATNQADIAVVRVDPPIKFRDGARPICLPKPGQDPKEGQVCILVGWGTTNPNRGKISKVPYEVDLPIFNGQKCEELYRIHSTRDQDYLPVNSTSEICTGSDDNHKSSCGGDSGGPLMCRFDGNRKWVLSGVVSRGGRDCGHPDYPSIFTRVSFFHDWIRKVICDMSIYRNSIAYCSQE